MKEYVSDLYEKIKGDASGLQNLLSKLPGLSGYMEKGQRREADQLLRQTISSRLEEVRLQLSNAHTELSRDIVQAMNHAEDLGRADTRLMGLIGKIRDAPEGYAGFFDAVKVKEDDLARLYAFDETMLAHVDAIEENVSNLETAVRDNGNVQSAIRALDQSLQDANQTFSQRNEILQGIA